jgi:hypothetical protein
MRSLLILDSSTLFSTVHSKRCNEKCDDERQQRHPTWNRVPTIESGYESRDGRYCAKASQTCKPPLLKKQRHKANNISKISHSYRIMARRVRMGNRRRAECPPPPNSAPPLGSNSVVVGGVAFCPRVVYTRQTQGGVRTPRDGICTPLPHPVFARTRASKRGKRHRAQIVRTNLAKAAADQPGRSKNRHQHPEGDQDQTEPEWWWIKRLSSRHRPTDSSHSQSENYQQDANNKHHPVLIHGNRRVAPFFRESIAQLVPEGRDRGNRGAPRFAVFETWAVRSSTNSDLIPSRRCT